MPNLRAIETFVKALEGGSIASAARQLGISPAAASQNIARLERELGQDIKSDLLWKANSIQALQEASEDLIQGRFHHAARLAKLCKVATVTPQHFNELAKGARGAPTLEG